MSKRILCDTGSFHGAQNLFPRKVIVKRNGSSLSVVARTRFGPHTRVYGFICRWALNFIYIYTNQKRRNKHTESWNRMNIYTLLFYIWIHAKKKNLVNWVCKERTIVNRLLMGEICGSWFPPRSHGFYDTFFFHIHIPRYFHIFCVSWWWKIVFSYFRIMW